MQTWNIRGSTLIDSLGRHRVLLIVLLLHCALWAGFDRFFSPHPDYIDHWTQSRHLSLSYYEHPPGVALLIRGLTTLLGNTEASLQAAALAVNLALLTLGYGLARRLYGARAGLFTLAALEATAFFQVKSTSIQTEQPLILFWLLSLGIAIDYLRHGGKGRLLLLGVATGLGALSKYVMILFYIGLFAYYTVVPSRRREWLNPWQYAGGLVSLLIFSPVLIWNVQHDWISFRFQLAKGGSQAGIPFGTGTVNFLAGFVFAYGTVLVVWALWRMLRQVARRELADGPDSLLTVMTLVPVAFFTVALLRSIYSDPQVAVIAMISLHVWLGGEASRLWEQGRRRFVAWGLGSALAINAVMVVLVVAHAYRPFLPIDPLWDPTRQIVGWREAGAETEQLLRERGIPLPAYVASAFYPLSSQFELHLSSHPLPFSFRRPERNLWIPPGAMTPENTLLVCTGEECNWLAPNAANRLGWSVKELGTVRPVVWGTPREEVRLFRAIQAGDAKAGVSR